MISLAELHNLREFPVSAPAGCRAKEAACLSQLQGAPIMAHKPAHWTIALLLGLGLTTGRTARAEDIPTLAKPPAYETSRLASAESNSGEPAALNADQSVATTDEAENNEVIRERYPNSAIKIERHVTQDAEGNYYNH